MKRLFLCLLFFFTNLLLSHGFAPSTLVTLADETQQTLSNICNQVAKRKSVKIVSSDHRLITYKTITCAGYSKTNCYIRLGFDDEYDEWWADDVVCTPTQEFYVPARGGWTPAHMLRPGDVVAAYNSRTATVTFVQGVPKDLVVYTICVPDTEIFFAGKHRVMVHNSYLALEWSLAPGFVSLSLGSAAGSFLAGPAGIVGGIAACTIALIAQALLRKHICAYKGSAYNRDYLPTLLRADNNQKNKLPVLKGGKSPQNGNKKNDEDDKNKHPNGVHIGAGYHHPNSKGSKSPGPKNGQQAVDKSVPVEGNSGTRVGVSEGQIVVLQRTSNGVYHGYVDTYKRLETTAKGQKIIRALLKNNMIDKKGRIIV